MQRRKLNSLLLFLFYFLFSLSAHADCTEFSNTTPSKSDPINLSWSCFNTKEIILYTQFEQSYDDELKKDVGFCSVNIIYSRVHFDFFTKWGAPTPVECKKYIGFWNQSFKRSKEICVLGANCQELENDNFVVNWTKEQIWYYYALKSELGCTEYVDGMCKK